MIQKIKSNQNYFKNTNNLLNIIFSIDKKIEEYKSLIGNDIETNILLRNTVKLINGNVKKGETNNEMDLEK